MNFKTSKEELCCLLPSFPANLQLSSFTRYPFLLLQSYDLQSSFLRVKAPSQTYYVLFIIVLKVRYFSRCNYEQGFDKKENENYRVRFENM